MASRSYSMNRNDIRSTSGVQDEDQIRIRSRFYFHCSAPHVPDPYGHSVQQFRRRANKHRYCTGPHDGDVHQWLLKQQESERVKQQLMEQKGKHDNRKPMENEKQKHFDRKQLDEEKQKYVHHNLMNKKQHQSEQKSMAGIQTHVDLKPVVEYQKKKSNLSDYRMNQTRNSTNQKLNPVEPNLKLLDQKQKPLKAREQTIDKVNPTEQKKVGRTIKQIMKDEGEDEVCSTKGILKTLLCWFLPCISPF